jgi:predicted CXXCH cytochrome family protein
MARSFYRPSPETTLDRDPDSKPFYHAPTRAYYSTLRRDGKYYQRRWQSGSDGKPEYLQEWQIDFVMGSGNHVRTYLHRSTNGTLIELPLAWYSEKKGYWGMNPGYDGDHFKTPRKIAYECMFCHNAYPGIPTAHERTDSLPVYQDPLPEGIDCQRCHGPGARHLQAAQAKTASGGEDLRKTIINPARLSRDGQMEVCMQCHLQTTSLHLPSAIRRFDRGPFSYRPGESLASFMLFFDRAEAQPKFEIVNSVVRLRESRCYLESKGALTCLTCHDPHELPSGEVAAARYSAICRNCHDATLQRLTQAGKHTSAADCAGCHMPKRRTTDVVHAVMTDHLIQRKPPEDRLAAIPEIAETESNAYRGAVVPYYPKSLSSVDDTLYLAVAQVEHNSNLNKGIEQLSQEIERQRPARAEFYFQLGEAWRSKGDAAKAVVAYEQALKRDPGSAWTMQRLAEALLATGQRIHAASVLNRAVQVVPDDARSWYALGDLDADLGRKAAAIAAFQKAVQLDPDLPDAYNGLGTALAESGNPAEAEKAFQSALRIQPDLADAQANLAVLVASQDRLIEAAQHFERAVLGKPADTVTRCNFAITLARLNRPGDAERQFRLAIETDPKFAASHDFLGTLLKNEGRTAEAIGEYREAIQVNPDFSRAQFDLGLALAESGDVNGAREPLRRAASGRDASIQQQARQVLEKIGRGK